MKRRRVEKEIIGIDWDSEAEDKAAFAVKKSNKKKPKVVESSASDSDDHARQTPAVAVKKSKKNTKVVDSSSSDSDDHARQTSAVAVKKSKKNTKVVESREGCLNWGSPKLGFMAQNGPG